MAKDTPKYIDIKAPEKTTPSSSSRPLVVTNRSLIGDPMVTTDADSNNSGDTPTVPLARTAKTINPVNDDLATPEKGKTTVSNETPDNKPSTTSGPVAKTEPEVAGEISSTSEPEPSKSEIAAPKTDESSDEPKPLNRDAAAESSADAAKATADAEAKAAREVELEQLIESGKYAAPINAVHRKRSQMVAVVLCLVALLLGVAVLDASLDAGLIKLSGIPHTNYLKDK